MIVLVTIKNESGIVFELGGRAKKNLLAVRSGGVPSDATVTVVTTVFRGVHAPVAVPLGAALSIGPGRTGTESVLGFFPGVAMMLWKVCGTVVLRWPGESSCVGEKVLRTDSVLVGMTLKSP